MSYGNLLTNEKSSFPWPDPIVRRELTNTITYIIVWQSKMIEHVLRRVEWVFKGLADPSKTFAQSGLIRVAFVISSSTPH